MTGTGRAPRIETERLVLEAHGPGHHAESLSLWSHPEVVRFIGGRPSTAEEVFGRLVRYAGMWSLFGYGFWAVRERAGGRFVGEIGFGEMGRDLDPPFDAPEAGWAFLPEVHGRGVAAEALRAALAFADAHPAMGRTVCMIDPRNVASIRLAERCGYEGYGRGRYREEAVSLFERRRPG